MLEKLFTPVDVLALGAFALALGILLTLFLLKFHQMYLHSRAAHRQYWCDSGVTSHWWTLFDGTLLQNSPPTLTDWNCPEHQR